MILFLHSLHIYFFFFFFFNDTATTEIYTLSLHDALPIYRLTIGNTHISEDSSEIVFLLVPIVSLDRKSTRLNSSHSQISYAVFCLKKKKKKSHSMATRWRSTPPLDASSPWHFWLSRTKHD